MRIAQVTPYFVPVDGGVERHVLNLSLELMRLGHDVEVFTCNGTRNGEQLESSSEVQGIPVHRFRSYLSLGEFGKVWPGFSAELLNGKYDIIHAHSYRHPHTDISLIVSKLARCGSVLTPHSPFHPNYLRAPLARVLVPIYDVVLAPFSLRSYDKVVSLTPAEARILRSMGVRNDQIAVIPHGVEERNFGNGESRSFVARHKLEGKEVVLYIGRINRTKGLDVLIEAFAYVARICPRAVLVMAGPCTSREEGEFRDKLFVESRTLKISEQVIFTGRLSEQEKMEAYHACALFVLPSIYEPYGIVLLEAAAHAKPLVSTLTDGPVSIIEDGISGRIVEPGDVHQLATAILEILDNEGLKRFMGERARDLALFHRWDRVARITESVYLDAGDKGRRPIAHNWRMSSKQ